MTNKMNTSSLHTQTIAALQTSNDNAMRLTTAFTAQNDDAINKLNLLERKTHYLAETIKFINGIESYVKLVYWLAFLTWIACIIYERTFTMKTAALFVLFTTMILMQNRIMDSISFMIPADVNVKW